MICTLLLLRAGVDDSVVHIARSTAAVHGRGPPPRPAVDGLRRERAQRAVPTACACWSCLPSLRMAGATITSTRWNSLMEE